MRLKRVSPLNGGTILYAPGRARRARAAGATAPRGKTRGKTLGKTRGMAEPDCPFCPGNEHLLPDILAQTPARGGEWRIRIVPNRYPILSPDAREASLRGHHEVIIESPDHGATLTSMDNRARAAALNAYAMRIAHWQDRPGIKAVILFHNEGAAAGASQPHPHAQIMALNAVPPGLRTRETLGRAHFRHTGRTLWQTERDGARQAGREVLRASGFTALVPYAAEAPGEIWIGPSGDDTPRFDTLSARARSGLARCLGGALARLDAAFGQPAYHMMLLAPSRAARDGPGAYWLFRILPRTATRAGFEIAAGLTVCPSLPEDDARQLRRMGR